MAYNDKVSFDVDYHDRMNLLVELLDVTGKDKPVRKLLRECLKYYPLSNKEAIRSWMSINTAIKASAIWAERIMSNRPLYPQGPTP